MATIRKNIQNLINKEGNVDGSMIEAPKFLKMLDNFDKSEYAKLLGKQSNNGKDYKRAITYDKELIKGILSQKGCKGLRLYFCLENENDPTSLTIALCGVKEDKNDLIFFKNNSISHKLELDFFKLSNKVLEDGTGFPPPSPASNNFHSIEKNTNEQLEKGSTVIKFLNLLKRKKVL